MIEMAVNVITLLLFLSILERVIGTPIIKPAFQLGKAAVEGITATITAAFSILAGMISLSYKAGLVLRGWLRTR